MSSILSKQASGNLTQRTIKAVRCPAGIENFFTNTGREPLSNAFLIVGGIIFC
jgi:hypothetical protein